MFDTKCLKFYAIGLMAIAFMAGTTRAHTQSKKKQSERKPEPQATKKGLRLSIELFGQKFRPKDSLELKMRLKNVGKSPIWIHKDLGFGPAGFLLTITDAKGRWLRSRMVAESFPSPISSKEDLQTIQPGKAIEEDISINLDFYEIAPGAHEVALSYQSPVPSELVPAGLRALTIEDGPLEPKPLRFQVVADHHPVVQGGIKKPRELADYTPRTLKALSLTQLKEIENMNENRLIQSDIVPSRIRVVYEATSRPLSQNKKDLIGDWARRFAGAPETYTRPYENEVTFSEDGEQYWLAIRKEFVTRFEQELKKGETVDLFVIKLGSVRTADQWEPVLLVEKFAKP